MQAFQLTFTTHAHNAVRFQNVRSYDRLSTTKSIIPTHGKNGQKRGCRQLSSFHFGEGKLPSCRQLNILLIVVDNLSQAAFTRQTNVGQLVLTNANWCM